MIIIDTNSGLAQEIRQLPSPNQDARPNTSDISLLVIHNISLPPGQFGGDYIDQLFTNCLPVAEHPFFSDICQLQVSAHALIRRDGSITQYVPFNRRAWHAGQSCFEGRTRCNDFAIGIELEGTDDTPYEEVQYQALAELSLAIMQAYPDITLDRITGHQDIAPARKTDPGPAFDWPRYLALLSKTT